MNQKDLASLLDLANHHANATLEDIKTLCAHVLAYGFNSAFVNPYYVALAKEILAGKAKVGTAFSFPLGQDTQTAKFFMTKECISLGADELDIVPNNGLLLSDKGFGIYREELKEIVDIAKNVRADVIVKFIIETGYFLPDDPDLSQEKKDEGEIIIKRAAEAILASGADFVKICSGMGPRGASVNDVKLVREAIGNAIKVKVAGGIDTLQEAQKFLTGGANRIGTSHAVEIIKESINSSQRSVSQNSVLPSNHSNE